MRFGSLYLSCYSETEIRFASRSHRLTNRMESLKFSTESFSKRI
jgi:hypothetical protein